MIIMTNLKEEILEAIDNIDDIIMESEDCVMGSLLESYNKAVDIISNSNPEDDLGVYDIFQESSSNTQGVSKPDKRKNIFIRFISFITKQAKRFVDYLKDKFANKQLEKATDELIDVIDKIDFDDLFGDADFFSEAFSPFKSKSKTMNIPKTLPTTKPDNELEKFGKIMNKGADVIDSFADNQNDKSEKLKSLIKDIAGLCKKTEETKLLQVVITTGTKLLKSGSNGLTKLCDKIEDSVNKEMSKLSDDAYFEVLDCAKAFDKEMGHFYSFLEHKAGHGDGNANSMNDIEIFKLVEEGKNKEAFKLYAKVLRTLVSVTMDFNKGCCELIVMCNNMIDSLQRRVGELDRVLVDSESKKISKIVSCLNKLLTETQKAYRGQPCAFDILNMVKMLKSFM